jgi:hypothetical protein
MREQAHRIAVQRRDEWWNGLSTEQKKQLMGERDDLTDFKPGVIELDPAHSSTPYSVQEFCLLLGLFVPLDELASQPQEELEAATLWAMTVHLEASDNDVIIAPRPEWLPSRDSASAGEECERDREAHGGEERVRQLYNDDWLTRLRIDREPEEPEEPEPFQVGDLESRLREIVDSLRGITPPETAAGNASWLEEWIDQGCPMFDRAPEPSSDPEWNTAGIGDGSQLEQALKHDSPDTCVGEDTSSESFHGHDSISGDDNFTVRND